MPPEFTPVTRDVVLAALEADRMHAALRRLDELASPSLRLRPHRSSAEQLPMGATRLGGCPDLPRGLRWPSCDGAPLSFVAQLRLADLVPFRLSGSLPPSGNLCFFSDATRAAEAAEDPRGGCRVVYADDGVPLTRRPLPLALDEPMRSYRWCGVTFHEELTLPPSSMLDPALTPAPLALLSEVIPRGDVERYRALRRRLAASQLCHRVWGHPDASEASDPRVAAARALTGGAAVAAADVADFQLLLQLDSDDAAAMTFGAGGRLSFWVRRSALARRNLDDAWCVLDG